MRIHPSLYPGPALAFAPADTRRAGATASGPVAEIVTFKLNDGVTDAVFVKAAEGTESFVSAAPGFITRWLSKGDDGSWTDYVMWADLESAKSLGASVMEEPSFAPLMQAIAPESVVMRHESVVWQMDQN